IAKGQLVQAAADELGVPAPMLQTSNGVITAPDGRQRTYGSLVFTAAAPQTKTVSVQLKSAAAQTIVGKPHSRVDALDIVTGRKQFAMDLKVPNALPTMVCRPPTLN